jgi:endonuclease/exonuclease/phosphatase family metal-dependent hydrolase
VESVVRESGLNFDYFQGPNKPDSNPVPIAWNTEVFLKIDGPAEKWVASDQYGGRYMTWVRLQHKATGLFIFFANTHGPLGNCGSELGKNWAAGVSDNKKPSDIVFFTGDFNCGTNSPAMEILKGSLINDANDIDGGIDQILTDYGRKLSGGIEGGYPSDHPLVKGSFRIAEIGPTPPPTAPTASPTCAELDLAVDGDRAVLENALGCYQVTTREKCCRSIDGRVGSSYGGQPCVPSKPAQTFNGNQVCEPLNHVVSTRQTCKVGACAPPAPTPSPTPSPAPPLTPALPPPTPPPTQPPAEDVYRWVGAPTVGGWGGRCRCPGSGVVYEVGDNYDSCASLACVGGEVVEECGNGVISSSRAGWMVTCGGPSPPTPPTPAPPPTSASELLRVLSYNVWWWGNPCGGKQYACLGGMHAYWKSLPRLSLAGVQECDGGWGSLKEYLGGTVDYLELINVGGALCTLYDRDRFDFLKSGRATVGRDSWSYRYLAYVRLRDRSTGTYVFFVNTHWDHERRDALGHAQNTANAIEAESEPGDAVVVVGDFNQGSTNPVFSRVFEDKVGLRLEGRGSSHGLIDMIWTNHQGGSDCESPGDSSGGPGSDHNPVLCDFSFGPTPAPTPCIELEGALENVGDRTELEDGRGCYQLATREECCGASDGRRGSAYYGEPCIPSKADLNFGSNVCEPRNHVVATQQSCQADVCA